MDELYVDEPMGRPVTPDNRGFRPKFLSAPISPHVKAKTRSNSAINNSSLEPIHEHDGKPFLDTMLSRHGSLMLHGNGGPIISNAPPTCHHGTAWCIQTLMDITINPPTPATKTTSDESTHSIWRVLDKTNLFWTRFYPGTGVWCCTMKTNQTALSLRPAGESPNSQLKGMADNMDNGDLGSTDVESPLITLDSFRNSLRPSKEFFKSRLSAVRRVRNRLMQKNGICNISLVNVPKQKRKFVNDIFTTLVDVKWRWCLLVFAAGFMGSWLLFSVIYYLIIFVHGDLDHVDDENWTPCIHNIQSYVSVFVFSVVSQHTIGYGHRYPSNQCAGVLVTICFQSMVGVMIQTLMAGVVFAKIARPKKRAETILFSRNAVICMRDGQLCFLFRIGDMRKSVLAEAHVRMQMIKKRITAEGELLAFHQFDMNVGYDLGLDRIFVMWPITICHVIDDDSPLYDLSADDLRSARFEIVVILEGVVDSTGSTTQARTSYIPTEVLWGHRFEKLVTYQRDNGEYRIDFGRFHNTNEVNMPTCSAKQLDDMRDAGLQPELPYQCGNMEEIENMGMTPYSTIQAAGSDLRPSLFEHMMSQQPPDSPQIKLQITEATDDKGDMKRIASYCKTRQNSQKGEHIVESGAESPPGESQVVVRGGTLSPEIIIRSPSQTSLRSRRSLSPDSISARVKKKSVLREHDIM